MEAEAPQSRMQDRAGGTVSSARKRRTIKPGPGRIAIKRITGDGRYDIGNGKFLYLAQNPNNEGVLGEVVAVCDPYYAEGTTQRIEPDYKVGDVVLVGKWTGTEVSVDRDSWLIISEQNILCELIEVDDDAKA
jgi:chaperonin GroES